jgi:hypothetical protein
MVHVIHSFGYQRNGVGGAGFYQAVVESLTDGGWHRFLCIDMCGEVEDRKVADRSMFAVIDLDMAHAGEVGLNNCWRGADSWGDDLAPVFRALHGRTDVTFPYEVFNTATAIEDLNRLAGR